VTALRGAVLLDGGSSNSRHGTELDLPTECRQDTDNMSARWGELK